VTILVVKKLIKNLCGKNHQLLWQSCSLQTSALEINLGIDLPDGVYVISIPKQI
jgi:hypothetical protein